MLRPTDIYEKLFRKEWTRAVHTLTDRFQFWVDAECKFRSFWSKTNATKVEDTETYDTKHEKYDDK